MHLLANILALVLATSLAAYTLRWWHDTPCPVTLDTRMPGETQEETASIPLQPGDHCNRLTTTFTRSQENPPQSPIDDKWPHFRGADRNNLVDTRIDLAETWPREGPPVVWQTAVGDGHAGAAVYEGRVYLLDYDEDDRRDVLRCLSLADGSEIWRRSYEVTIKRNHGVSRTVPAVSEKFVVTMGPKCHVMCVDRETGDLNWGLDLSLDYGTDVPLWYTGQCPIIDDGLAILAPAGDDLMMAVDCTNGDIIWRAPNPEGWRMSHSSIVTMEFGGRRVFVYAALGGIAAVVADGPDRGQILWKTSLWDHRIVAPCPVQVSENQVFMTSGHGAGSILLNLDNTSGPYSVTAERVIDKTVFAAEQQTPILKDGALFGVLPKDAGAYREELAGYDPLSGEVLWRSGRDLRFGLGPTLFVGDRLFAMDDEATLSMLRADRSGISLLAQAQVIPEARDAWGPPAFVGGLLLLRDSTRLVCLDLRPNPPTQKE